MEASEEGEGEGEGKRHCIPNTPRALSDLVVKEQEGHVWGWFHHFHVSGGHNINGMAGVFASPGKKENLTRSVAVLQQDSRQLISLLVQGHTELGLTFGTHSPLLRQELPRLQPAECRHGSQHLLGSSLAQR